VRRSTAIAAVVAIFLVGVLVGALGSHAFFLHRSHQPGRFSGWGTRLVAADLKHRLDLTPAQETQIDRILSESRTEAVALHREVLPRMLALLDRTHARISVVLTPAQRVEFERFRARHRSRLVRMLSG